MQAQNIAPAGEDGNQIFDFEAHRLARSRWVWHKQLLRIRELPGSAIRVGGALLDYINKDTADAWPSQAALADAAGLSVRQTIRALKILETAGFIKIVERGGGTVRGRHGSKLGRTCHYSLALPKTAQTAGVTATPYSDISGGHTLPSVADEPSREPPTSKEPIGLSEVPVESPSSITTTGIQPTRKEVVGNVSARVVPDGRALPAITAYVAPRIGASPEGALAFLNARLGNERMSALVKSCWDGKLIEAHLEAIIAGQEHRRVAA